MIRCHSSFRAVSLRVALSRAAAVANHLGISRVTDITRLDRIGLPVFASVRPGAVHGSLCVNAGKGLTASEARVGAYMEAIEFALAESNASSARVVRASARLVLDGSTRLDAILDLCPLVGVSIPLDEKLPCVAACHLKGDAKVLVPAELVFCPFLLPPRLTFFGTSTNGLASGSTLAEATLHGLLEAIERDVASFEWLRPSSLLVSYETLPEKHQRIIQSLRRRGFEIAIRWLPNDHRIACFHAVLWECERLDPVYITDGYGCHLDPEIALTRALTEAVQGRLTYIHGARDDIWERRAQFVGWSESRKESYAQRLLSRARRVTSLFDFHTAVNGAADAITLNDLLEKVCAALAGTGINHVLRVELTPPRSPVAVVRIIVPLLEYFTPSIPRVGPRLAQFATGA